MSTPELPSGEPEAGSPFDPQRIGDERWPGRPALVGCGIGCSVLLILGLTLLVVVGAKSGDMVNWALRMSEETLTEAAPEDWREEDRIRLSEAYRQAAQAIAGGFTDTAALLELNRVLTECLQSATRSELTRNDLLGLAEALFRVAGRELPLNDDEARPRAFGSRSVANVGV
jgi:hypothetical protein